MRAEPVHELSFEEYLIHATGDGDSNNNIYSSRLLWYAGRAKKKKIKAFWELSSFTNIGSYESQFSSMHLKSNEPGSVNRHVSESRKSHN